MKRVLPYCLIAMMLFSSVGCSGRDDTVSGGPDSFPGADQEREDLLDSFPETPYEPIDPLNPADSPGYATISVEPLNGALMPRSAAPAKSDELDILAVEDELLLLINVERGANNLDLLDTDDTVLWAARLRCSEVLSSFSHTRPDGTPYYTVFDEVGFSYSGKWHGENASVATFPDGAYTEQEIASLIYADLLESQGHTRNMLRAQYNLVGVGAVAQKKDGYTTVSSVQLFSSK